MDKDINELKQNVKELKNKSKVLEGRIKEIEKQIHEKLIKIPNIPHESVTKETVIISEWQ